MRVLSLFDGISCGRVALERAGIPVEKYYASEIDKYAIQIAQKNYPDTIQIGDVCKVDFSKYIGNVDLIIGGSPCQGFSFAGKQLNFNDPRSKLFFEFVRAIKTIKPKYFLLENVKMKKEYQDIISDLLGVQPIEINSALVSAQNRKRLYWTNIPNVGQPADKGILLKDIVHEYHGDIIDIEKYCLSEKNLVCCSRKFGSKAPDITGKDKSNTITAAMGTGGGNIPFMFHELEKYIVPFDKTLMILEKEIQRGKIGYFRCDAQANRVYDIHGKAVCLCGDAGGGAAKMGQYLFGCLTPDRVEKRQNGQRFNFGNKFYTLTAQDIHGVLTGGYIRKLTPIECERLQTLPDNWTEKGTIQWNYVSVMGATENVKLTLDSALCTINDGKDVEQQSCQNTKDNSVNFVAELQLQEKCAIGTIRIGKGTKTQNTQIILDVGITDTAIRNPKENIKSNIENLSQNLLEEICCQQKWSIILTLIKKTIQEKTYSFAQKHNINKYTLNCKLSQGNLLEMDLSSLKMESIVEISDSQRYKMLGNGWTVDVIAHIFNGLKD